MSPRKTYKKLLATLFIIVSIMAGVLLGGWGIAIIFNVSEEVSTIIAHVCSGILGFLYILGIWRAIDIIFEDE